MPFSSLSTWSSHTGGCEVCLFLPKGTKRSILVDIICKITNLGADKLYNLKLTEKRINDILYDFYSKLGIKVGMIYFKVRFY